MKIIVRLGALLLLLLAPITASCQSFPGVGNGSGGGSAGSVSAGNGGGCFPLIGANGVGNGSGNPYPAAYTSLIGSTGVITSKGFQGNGLSGGGMVFSMMTKATFADPCNSSKIIVAMDQACNNNAGASNCTSVPAGSTCDATHFCTEPATLIYDFSTSTLTSDTTLIDSDANGGNASCHDCSSIMAGVSPGQAWETYGAVTIGNNAAPAGWGAFNGTGGASGGTPCTNCAAQPVIFGGNLNVATDPLSFLCRSACAGGGSNKAFLPAAGMSEMGCAQTSWLPGALVLCSGQTQKGTTFNVDVGIQGILLGHLTCTGQINCLQFDTQCGEQALGTATTALCNGIYQITSKAYFDVWYVFAVATTTNSATQTATFNPPGAAACGSNLTVSLTTVAVSTPSPQTAVDAVSAYNSDSTHSCPNTRFKLAQVSNASWQPQCPAVTTACIAVLDKNGDPNLDSQTPGTPVCSPGTATAFTCSTVNWKGSLNLNTSFSFGTVRAAPQLCNNCFVQLGSVELDTNLVTGAYSSNYDNAYYAFLIQPNSSGHGFKYCSIDGYNCIAVDLTTLGGSTPQSVLRLLGGGGVGTVAAQTNCTGACASGTADPKENMPAGWCSNSVAPIGTSQGATNCLVGTTGGANSANPFLIRCPASTVGANLPACGTNPPFQFSWTSDAQAAAEAAQGGMATSGRDLGFDGLGLGSASIHVTYYGRDSIGHAAVNDLRISTLNRQVTLNQIGDTSGAVAQNAGVNVSNSTGPSGTMYATWGTGDSGAMNFGTGKNCSSVNGATCLVQCKSTDYVTWGNCVVELQVAPGTPTNVLAPRNAIYDMPDGFAVLDLWASMGSTTCTLGTNCNYGLYLHSTP